MYNSTQESLVRDGVNHRTIAKYFPPLLRTRRGLNKRKAKHVRHQPANLEDLSISGEFLCVI